VPEKASSSNSYFRASNYPVGAVGAGGAVTVTYGSYLNPHSREANGCAPTGLNPDTGINTYDGVKTPGACNNDILASVSTDGGRSFDMAGVDPRAQRSLSPAGATDQFWQWYAVTGTGTGVLSTYDRQYADDETTGASDVTVVAQTSRGLDSTRATSSPMPPPTQFSGTFYGDYSGLAADRRAAYPLWSDTRNADLFLCPGTGAPGHPPATCTGSASNAPQANDQEIYTTRVDVRR